MFCAMIMRWILFTFINFNILFLLSAFNRNFWDFVEVHMLSRLFYFNFGKLQFSKIRRSVLNVWYSRFHLCRTCIDFLRKREESRLWIIGVPRIRRLSDGATEKSRTFGAAEAITQIVYLKEADRSGEMG